MIGFLFWTMRASSLASPDRARTYVFGRPACLAASLQGTGWKPMRRTAKMAVLR